MPTEVVVGLFTLAGVALGFAGQWLTERQRIRRTREGMVKAMLGELRHNAGVCVDIRHVGPDASPSTYSTDTWEAARFELAQFVPDQLFEDLLFIYEDMLPRVQSRLDEWGKIWPDKGIEDLLSSLEEDIKRAMKHLLSLREAGSFRSRWKIGLRDEESPPEVSEG